MGRPVIVTVGDLKEILTKQRSQYDRDASPGEALAIAFVSPQEPSHDAVTYQTADGGLLVVDVDKQGRAVRLEIV